MRPRRLEQRSVGHVRRVVGAHGWALRLWSWPAPAGSFWRSSSGSSAAVACWLNWSTRIYAAMAQRSRGGIRRRVGIHGSVAPGHHVEEVADRLLAQLLAVIRRRRIEAAADDHAAAVARLAVARDAVDPVSLLAALRATELIRPGTGRSRRACPCRQPRVEHVLVGTLRAVRRAASSRGTVPATSGRADCRPRRTSWARAARIAAAHTSRCGSRPGAAAPRPRPGGEPRRSARSMPPACRASAVSSWCHLALPGSSSGGRASSIAGFGRSLALR